jgi:hypothetical protein
MLMAAQVYTPLRYKIIKRYTKMSYEDGLFEDEGIMASWPEDSRQLLLHPELSEDEPVAPQLVRTQELIMQGVDYTVDAVRRHRKAAVALGGTVLGSLGFATGAVIFTHRHAH